MLKELIEQKNKQKTNNSILRLDYTNQLREELEEANISFSESIDNRSNNTKITIKTPGGFTNLVVYVTDKAFEFNNNTYVFDITTFEYFMKALSEKLV